MDAKKGAAVRHSRDNHKSVEKKEPRVPRSESVIQRRKAEKDKENHYYLLTNQGEYKFVHHQFYKMQTKNSSPLSLSQPRSPSLLVHKKKKEDEMDGMEREKSGEGVGGC